MLEVKHLQKTFGAIQAVRDVTFAVAQGEVLGFLGPNGAGKTTTMRMITGFLPPSSGTAVINGHDIQADPIGAKKQIGYLPENAPVYADMTVCNYLSFLAEIRGFTGKANAEQVARTMVNCRLDDVKRQAIGTLSKGYRQRVCLAQALLHDPAVLVMDEPTDGLDPNQKHLVRGMIRAMAARKAIVISTHILEEVEALCTRVIIIRRGAVVANGTPAELKAKSRHAGAVELTFPAEPGEFRRRLEQLPSAARVEIEGTRATVFARAQGNGAPRLPHEVLALLRSAPEIAVSSVRPLEGRLDDVFRSLTEIRD